MRRVFVENGNALKPVDERAYQREDELQKLLSNNPNLIADDAQNSEHRYLLINREVGVPDRQDSGSRWAIDHVMVDNNCVLTFVEAKLSHDQRARREVIAQMLDYVANGVRFWTITDLRTSLQNRLQSIGEDEDGAIQDLTYPYGLGSDQFWEQVSNNLRAGKIRIVFLADELSDELLRIIEFLNEQMHPAEVHGFEIKKYLDGDSQIYMPQFYGKTSETERKKEAGTRAQGDSSLQLIVSEYNKLAKTIKGNTANKTARYKKLEVGHPDVHYEWYKWDDRTLGVAIHFEAPKRYSHNIAKAEEFRDVVKQIAERYGYKYDVGQFMNNYARAEIIVTAENLSDDQIVNDASAIMSDMIDETYDSVQQIPYTDTTRFKET